MSTQAPIDALMCTHTHTHGTCPHVDTQKISKITNAELLNKIPATDPAIHRRVMDHDQAGLS